MSEIQNLESDLSNFAQTVEQDVKVVFQDIVTGASYSEQIITNVLTDAIPVADAVVSIIAPQDITYVNIISQVLGAIKAIAENTNTLATIASDIAQGANVSVQEATQLATDAKTAYQATVASINNISSLLTPIVQNAIVTVKKDV